MTDYISREALLDTLDECISKCEEMLPLTPAQVHEMRGEINATKAIRVFVKRFDADDVRENKRGKWIRNNVVLNRQVCSICSARFDTLENDNYCPNCGADMREEQT